MQYLDFENQLSDNNVYVRSDKTYKEVLKFWMFFFNSFKINLNGVYNVQINDINSVSDNSMNLDNYLKEKNPNLKKLIHNPQFFQVFLNLAKSPNTNNNIKSIALHVLAFAIKYYDKNIHGIVKVDDFTFFMRNFMDGLNKDQFDLSLSIGYFVLEYSKA